MQVQVHEPQDCSDRINKQGTLLLPHSCSPNSNGNHAIAIQMIPISTLVKLLTANVVVKTFDHSLIMRFITCFQFSLCSLFRVLLL